MEISSAIPAAMSIAAYSPASKEAHLQLVEEMKSRGLYKRTYAAYILCTLIGLLGMTGSLIAIMIFDSLAVTIASALILAFSSVQLGMIGHDMSHGEVFEASSRNRFYAMLNWGLLGGLSESRWFHKHSAHHEEPNHMDHDPDLDIPFIFSAKQIHSRSAFFKRWILPRQHIYFWLALPFIYPANVIYSMAHIYKNMTMRTAFEILLMVIHFAVLFYIPFAFLPFWNAVVFTVLTFVAIGAYMSFVFAPNHKGEDVLDPNEEFNWTHQITLTRNLYPSWAAFYLCGGLNFQIEHHLFPTMSRFKYWEAHTITEEYCKKHGIQYTQTTWLESLKEIHISLKETALVAKYLP